MPRATLVDRVYHNFEFEAAEQDSALAKCFVPPTSFSELKATGSAVIVGRFGSGKTALVKRLAAESKIPIADRTEIYFKIDPLSAELQDAAGKKDFATLARALIYLRFIYDYAEKSKGNLIKGDYAALTSELKSLKLHPYRDLIGRIAESITNLAGRIKKIDFGEVFGFELHDPSAGTAEPSIRRYRELVLKIDGIVQKLLVARPHLLIVDSVDPTRLLLEETAGLIGALVRWLQYPGMEGAQNFRFLICLPFPVFKAFGRSGVHVPSEQVFVELRWRPTELKNIVLQRVADGVNGDPESWLRENLGINLDEALRYTFGRPRDCIKLVRFCLLARMADTKASPQDCWRKGVEDYSRAVLEFMSVEWHLNAEGWDDVRAVLSNLERSFPKETLYNAIKEIREAGILKDRAAAGIVEDFEALGLVRKTGGSTFELHPTLRESTRV